MTAQNPVQTLLTPQNSALILIDHQPQMAFGVQSIDRQTLINNVTGLAKAAKIFQVPTVLTTVAAKTFSGDIFPELQAVFPGSEPIDRTSMNSWDDPNFLAAVRQTGRRKLIIAALWTEVCLAMPAIDALREGYEVYIVTDASGGTSKEAHDMAVQRLIQAGAVPVTWLQVLLEFQRDWARQETYDATLSVALEHGGAYGIGIRYAKSILGAHASEAGTAVEA
ncbi:MAG: hydrolase [Roseiflexaceae bacterium]